MYNIEKLLLLVCAWCIHTRDDQSHSIQKISNFAEFSNQISSEDFVHVHNAQDIIYRLKLQKVWKEYFKLAPENSTGNLAQNEPLLRQKLDPTRSDPIISTYPSFPCELWPFSTLPSPSLGVCLNEVDPPRPPHCLHLPPSLADRSKFLRHIIFLPPSKQIK